MWSSTGHLRPMTEGPTSPGGEILQWKYFKYLDGIIFLFSRYVVEALDRTLGGDWFQVGEAAPGDRKVGINLYMFYFLIFNLISDRWRSSHWSTSTATGSECELSTRSGGLSLARCWATISWSRIPGVSFTTNCWPHSGLSWPNFALFLANIVQTEAYHYQIITFW